MLFVTLLAFAATCKIVPNNPMNPDDETYQTPTLMFNDNSPKNGDTVIVDEAVWFFTGNLGDKNQYRYKLDNKSWSEWRKVTTTGSEVRITLTRADTGKHTVTFQTCYNPINNKFSDTTFSFVRITAPLIFFEPADQTVTEGLPVSLSVVANGTALLYQWQRENEKIDSATKQMFSISTATLGDAGRYSCIVYNRAGEVESRYATVVVNKKVVPPLIATQPENKKVTEGQSVTFTIAATGTDLIYQWKKGDLTIPNASSSTYTIPSAAYADSGATFQCVISNSADTIISAKAVLSVEKKVYPPAITIQPASQSVAAGKTVTFAITVTGTDLRYQWQKDSANINSATSATLTIVSASSTDNGTTFRCIVWNTVDTVTSKNAVLTVTQNIVAPVITAQPVSSTVTAGQSASFSVTATGTDLHYQWYKDTTLLQGANSSTYSIQVVTTADSGKKFKCAIYNSADTVSSANAELKVVQSVIKPIISTNPESKTVSEGQPVTFSVKATGTDLKYQWQKNSSDITGATTNTYTIASTAFTDSGTTFICIVFNNADTVKSTAATLAVTKSIVAPAITVQPADQTVTEGQSATFAVTASGTSLSYQWKKGTAEIANATSATYTAQNVTTADDGSEYSCTIKNSAGTVTSRTAKLSVTQNITAPSITTHPLNATVKVNGSATFSVVATGTDLKYQWQKGTIDITGATASTYSIAAVTSGENGTTYRCVVRNAADTIESNPATLTVVYSVSYLGNGNETGTVPADTALYAQNGTVNIRSNTGLLARTGYSFGGWNRAQNGTGKNYLATDTLLMGTQNVQLYAKWNIDSLLVTFNSNNGSAVASKMVAYGGYVSEPAAPTKAGSAFAGWYSNQSLSTPFDFSTAITVARTLYAKWNPVYRVLYIANGGNGSAPVDNNVYQSGQLVTVLGISGLTRQYYDFAGWNTASNGSGVNRLVGTTFQIGSKNDTLYANWKISLPVITVQPTAVNPYPFDNISFSVTAEGIGLSYQWQKNDVNIPTANSSTLAKQKVSFSDSGYYRCVVTNSSGSATSSTAKLAIRKTVKDADSNEYSIVVIGDQIWTVENLRTTRFNDGTSIPMVNVDTIWTNLTTPGYCFYNYTTLPIEQRKWGALYNWYTVNSGKLAPAGWHIATDNDWETLELYLFDNGNNWDNSGFSALKGGNCSGTFSSQGEYGYWWSSTSMNESYAWARVIGSTTERSSRIMNGMFNGYSIRLVKN